jgi:hypothetical protein|tara:strand:+ start:1041 stop:2357 length:1317 start_codon:yes stop_codon:yes gene_type:complete
MIDIKKDYESKGFCLNWEDDIFPKCPYKDGSMEKISNIQKKIDDGDFDLTCFNVHDTELLHFLAYLQNVDFTENQFIPFLHTHWEKRNRSFLYVGQDNKVRYEEFQNSSYGKYLLDMCGYTEQFEKIKTLHNDHNWPYELTEEEINYLQTGRSLTLETCEDVPWYKHNSWAFRSDEFDFDSKGDSILTIGCSYVYGIGLAEKDRFSNLLSKTLGLKNYNLGISGGSHDQAYLFSQYLIPLLKPKHVVFLGPNIIRSYHFNENLFKYFVLQGFESNWKQDDISFVQHKTEHNKLFERDISKSLQGQGQEGCEAGDIYFNQYIKQLNIHYHKNLYMNKLNASRNVNAIKGLCYENKASFHYLYSDDIQLPYNGSINLLADLVERFVEDKKQATEDQVIEWIKKNKLDNDYEDYARDLCHPGKRTNQWLADYFLDSIKKVV